MRQGKVQPLSVTTGLYGRPFGGASGGMVLGVVWSTGSGKAAIATLLTLAAAMAPVMAPAPLKKLRLFVMSFRLVEVVFSAR